MAFKINDIYDKIYTLVSGALSGHTELYDKQEIENNLSALLDKGYTVIFGAAFAREDRTATCLYWVEREFSVVNTITVYAADLNTAIRKTTEKSLFDNQQKIIDAVMKSPTLSDHCQNLKFVGDSGIEYIYADERDNIMLRSRFSFEYYEQM